MIEENNNLQSTTINTIATLWLIDDDAALRLILEDTFTDANLKVISFAHAQAAWTRLNDILEQRESVSTLPDVILTDIRMPMMDGLSFSDWVHRHFPELPIVIMTAHSDITSAINSYQAGAFDYLPKPFDLDDAVAIIYKAISYQPSKNGIAENPNFSDQDTTDTDTSTEAVILEQDKVKIRLNQPKNSDFATHKVIQEDKAKNSSPSKLQPNKNKPPSQQTNKSNPSGIIGQSQAMQTVFRAIGRLAHSPITVLITGESGSGKELVANALHQHSPRAQQSFIALNMAAIPHDLIESELFGHEKGAFTGATTQRQGRFEQADGGTLFLDEIGDMPFSTQTRLLRVLANGEFYRVGGQQPVKVDVRIIAATHQDLEKLVKQGKFREDLFYRLNVIRMPLPPLRARREDIPALAEHFMERAGQQMSVSTKQLSVDAMRIMQTFDWRGNVRQLENVCLWLTVMATGDTVLVEDLPPELLANTASVSSFDNDSEISSENRTAQYHDSTTNDAQNSSINNDYYTPRWQHLLADWAKQALQAGETEILQSATPDFERVLLKAALDHSGGRKIAAATLLGWGRNTLTRKLQLLDTPESSQITEK